MQQFGQFLRELRDKGVMDVHLRITESNEDRLTFYVHPLDKDGKTESYVILNNQLVLNDIDSLSKSTKNCLKIGDFQ